jgi:hypothetical protein
LANFDLHGPLPRFAFLRHAQSGTNYWFLNSRSVRVPILQ